MFNEIVINHRNQEIKEILSKLLSLYPKYIDLTLSRMLRLLRELGDPHEKIAPVIHIAGTNGKGSVSAILAAIQRQSGKNIHVYTSPHLLNFNERINLSGKEISDELFLQILKKVEKINKNKEITFFEIITAVAFYAFSKIRSDLVILEVGLGGMLDATNVISKPILSIITPIGIDHTEFLGSTIESIANEKMGIIKKGTTVVVGKQKRSINCKIKEYSKNIGANIFIQDVDWQVKNSNLNYKDININLQNCNLNGSHQLDNASLAIMGCLLVPQLKVKNMAIKEGIGKVKWSGRIQKLDGKISKEYSDLDIWIDSAHNTLGFKSLLNWLNINNEKNILIMSIGKNKDIKSILDEISNSRLTEIVLISSGNKYYYNAYDIKKICDEKNIPTFIANDIYDALSYCAITKVKKRIVATGSIYFISTILSLDKGL